MLLESEKHTSGTEDIFFALDLFPTRMNQLKDAENYNFI